MKRKITDQLIRWKNSSDRKPMILNGARQVGKTFILREFGKEHYQNTIYINLELNHYAASLFDEDISPERLIKHLEAEAKERILPEKTLMRYSHVNAL